MKKLITLLGVIALSILVYAILSPSPVSSQGAGTAASLYRTAYVNLLTQSASSVRYCTNCQATSPCTSGGSGAFAFKVGSAWNCTDGGGVSGGANAALSNLASVSINTTLLAQSGVDLGSTTKSFRDLFLSGGGTYGTNYFRFTGTPTSQRTLTVPNETGTLCTTGSVCSGYQSTITFGTGVQTALGVNIGSAGAPVLFNGAGGTPSSITLTNGTGLPLSGHATQATNTIVGNATSGSAAPTALAIGTCSTAGSALKWTTNTGFGCNTAIDAATLGSATFAAPGAIGGGTPAAAAFTTLAATTSVYVGTGSASGGTFKFEADPGVSAVVRLRLGGNGAATHLAFNLGLDTGVGTLNLEEGATGAVRLSLTQAGLFSLPALTSDATHTDSSVCQDTTTHSFYSGSGAAGICLGTSSFRFKRDIRPLNIGLAQIVRLNPISFNYIKNYGDGGARRQVGFAAEDVNKIMPSLVGMDKDGKPQSVDYMGVMVVAVNALKELNDKFENYKTVTDAKLAAQQRTISKLRHQR
jgi:hypothetical protein